MNWKYVIGLVLSIFGSMLSGIVYGIIIGVPLYLVGIIFIVISKKSVMAKLLGIFLPPLFIVVAWGVLLVVDSYQRRPTPLTFLIPENFSGNIRVVNDENCGIAPKKEGGRLVLQIPETGLLIIRPAIKGYQKDNHEYYFVNATGTRTSVPAFDYITSDSTVLCVRSEGSRGLGGPNESGELFYNKPYGIDHLELTVFNPGHDKPRPTVALLDSLTLVTVVACRSREN